MTGTNLPHSGLTGSIIECFFKTYNELGSGFSERIYQRALRIVLIEHGLRVGYNVKMLVTFHGQDIGRCFADLIVNETVLLEIKARPQLMSPDIGQVMNYLNVAGGGVGLLLNFGPTEPSFKRIVVGDPLRSLPNLKLLRT